MAEIPENDRSITYAPVAATGPFPIDFPLFDGSGADLLVTLDGEEVAGWTFSGTIESGFYGAPNTWVNGSITFADPITGALVIDGRRDPRRQAQYEEGRGVPARDHNTEYNTLTATDQELRRDIDREVAIRKDEVERLDGRIDDETDARVAADAALDARLDAAEPVLADVALRAVRVPTGESGVTIPTIAQRRLKALGFALDGSPIAVDAVAVIDDGFADFSSTLAAASATLPVIQVFFRTAGFYAAGDGGGALFKRAASEPSHAGKLQTADGAWWEIAEEEIHTRMLGAVADGDVDDTEALNKASSVVLATGKKMVVNKGDYKISNTFGFGAVDVDVEVVCEPGARFIADAAFPAAAKMVQFTGGAGKKIVWRGGKFDGSLLPAVPGNDVMAFTVAGAELLLVQDVGIDVGDDFTSGSGDSGIFAGWARRMIFNRIKVRGATDAGIYLSGGSTGDGTTEFTEEASFDDLSFDACSVGLVIKRRFRRVSGGRVFVTDCPIGVAVGASALMGDGSTILQAEDVSISSVVSKRCDTAVSLSYVDNAHVGSIVASDVGCKIGSYTGTVSSSLFLQGAQRCHVGSVIIDGANADIGALTTIGVRASSRTVNGVERHSTDNAVGPIVAKDIGRSAQEDDANQNRNVYETGPEVNVTNTPNIQGAASALHRSRYGAPIVLAQSAVAVPLTGTTTETTLATIPVPGNMMGKNGRLRITCTWSYSGAGGAKTARVRLGGSAFNVIGGLSGTGSLRQQVEIANRNATNSQVAMASVSGGFGISASAPITAALDMTVSRDITLQGTLANTGDTVTLESYLVELMHGP